MPPFCNLVTQLPEGPMGRMYHLALDQEVIEGARFAFLPGDPERVPRIAKAFDPEAREIARRREFRTWLGRMEGKPVLVTSTGIGGPSASIAVEELARLGVDTFIRVGTCGAIAEGVKAGDVVVTTAAVRLDGTSEHYAPLEYPAVADFEVLQALVEAARGVSRRRGFSVHVGVTVSLASFYAGQERYDSFTGYVIRRFQGALEEWRKLGVLNCEMESATVLTLTGVMGLRGGCVTVALLERSEGEGIDEEMVQRVEPHAIETALEAMRKLVMG